MNVQECGFGHLYDTDQYASCPYCQQNNVRIDFGADSGIGKTVGIGVGVGAPQPQYSEVGSTVAPAAMQKPKEDAGIGKTVGAFQRTLSFEPVVGWLVCIDGPEKGKDFRIYGRNNTIGRSEKSDICLKADASISRENHARIAYDVKHNSFVMLPGDGANTVYVNDDPVFTPTAVKSFDVIECGEYKLLFVPFCSEKFTWQDGIKQEQEQV
ncbi:MAG: FHA domain-containing protein [Oscillospiraceae bacterium]|nr:FHA domain-containing protein [Oscillospiraceae bacterium]